MSQEKNNQRWSKLAVWFAVGISVGTIVAQLYVFYRYMMDNP